MLRGSIRGYTCMTSVEMLTLAVLEDVAHGRSTLLLMWMAALLSSKQAKEPDVLLSDYISYILFRYSTIARNVNVVN